jgi:cytochrome c oxidase subunit III
MVARTSDEIRAPLLMRLHPTMLGLWIFIATEALFFALLIGSYLYLRVRAGQWPPPDSPELDIWIPIFNSFVLLSSGVTMHGAHEAMRRGDRGLMIGGIAVTMVLGAAFLAGQAYEYAHAGFGLTEGILGSSFFTLTGFHGAHVLVGLILLGLIWWRAARGHFTAEHHVGVEAGALYWHFVDAVWVVLFVVIYIL